MRETDAGVRQSMDHDPQCEVPSSKQGAVARRVGTYFFSGQKETCTYVITQSIRELQHGSPLVRAAGRRSSTAAVAAAAEID